MFLDAGGVLVNPNWTRVSATLAEHGVLAPADRLAAAEPRAKRRLDLEVPAEEVQSRLRAWRAPEPRYRTGALAKYAALVGSSAQGAVCL